MTEAAAQPGPVQPGPAEPGPAESGLVHPGPTESGPAQPGATESGSEQSGLGGAGKAAAYALVLVLAVLLAVWGAFLVPLRVAGLAAPVCWFVAFAGNVVLGSVGGRLLGKVGAVVPLLVWAGLAFALSTRRTEGDLIVTGSVTGLGFLLAGAVGGAVAYGVQVTRLPSPR